jgi:hypothetical protein
MTMAEKLTQIAENEQKVFDAGYDEGFADGKQAEYDAFWDNIQNNGSEDGAIYVHAFAYARFTDANYHPKYPIIGRSGTSMNEMYYRSGDISDTLVPIYATNNISHMFSECYNLKTIRLLSLTQDTIFAGAFYLCSSLENLTIEGTIGQNGFNLQYSKKLSKASITSIIEHLSTTTSGLTVTFSRDAVNKAFETSEGANDGSTAGEWLSYTATARPKWNFSLV